MAIIRSAALILWDLFIASRHYKITAALLINRKFIAPLFLLAPMKKRKKNSRQQLGAVHTISGTPKTVNTVNRNTPKMPINISNQLNGSVGICRQCLLSHTKFAWLVVADLPASKRLEGKVGTYVTGVMVRK